jgi:hypothetical protein
MEEWARRKLLSENADVTRDANNLQLGGIKIFDQMLEVTLGDIEHFNELWKGLNEGRYPTRFEDGDPQRGGVDAAGAAG